jgi:hypothetical protein
MRWGSRLTGLLGLAGLASALWVTSVPAQLPLPDDLLKIEKQPRAELVVSSVLSTWTHFTVANIGNAPASPFTVALGPISENRICLVVWKMIRVDGLPAGGSVRLEAAKPPRDVAHPARFGQWIWVDVRDEVLEPGETNMAGRNLNLGNNTAVLPGESYPCATTGGFDVPRLLLLKR